MDITECMDRTKTILERSYCVYNKLSEKIEPQIKPENRFLGKTRAKDMFLNIDEDYILITMAVLEAYRWAIVDVGHVRDGELINTSPDTLDQMQQKLDEIENIIKDMGEFYDSTKN